jgi:NAD(P)-dependent dehydrogenase (short-subunit alcohol dehydrogenase family)
MLAYRASKAANAGLAVALHALYVGDADATAVRTRGGAERQLHRVVCVNPGFVQTGLGLESAPPGFARDAPDAFAAAKAAWGAAPLADGVDGVLWPLVARDGAVVSGKMYFKRAVVPF